MGMAPLFVGEVDRGLFLFPWRPEERDSSLGGRYFKEKRDPSSIHRDFLKNSANLGQLERPRWPQMKLGAGASVPE